ncbi:hypothetical protein TNCV_2944231 [Trichonephila clavipes]|nr:hypothetical protein TNCV_2944231 [Trichonephila clavipes]
MKSCVCSLQCDLALSRCKRKTSPSGLILQIRYLSDRNVAQYLSEFTVNPLVRKFEWRTPLASQKMDPKIQVAMRKWIRSQPGSFFMDGMKKWIERLNKCVAISDNYDEQ